MMKFLKALWQKIQHPVRMEAAILFTGLALAISQGIQWLSDNVDSFSFARGDWRPVVLAAFAALATRWKVWSAKAVAEIEGGDTPPMEPA